MINLSSSRQEREACIKLLTAMVTISSTLAKDILIHVNFHSTNVELLTKHTGEQVCVRDHFVHFLTAFLVDGHYPTLSVLLEKKGFITSIISGLQFDKADTVCVVISAMKNHILENPSVSKTAKMKTFNTSVVRDIVNLYNWKGPESFRNQKKHKNVTITVDEIAKSRVSECVHDFLLTLCTSSKFGVIFKDHSMGLGKKNQNSLMYTVLESLERPWEHSYACELVTKICGACPDLAKTMWANLKTSLEPRLTSKWLNAINFAKILLKELHPDCIEFCAKELSVHQLAQIIQILVAPLPILRTIIPENRKFEQQSIKQHVTALLLEMLRSLQSYIFTSRNWLDELSHQKLHDYLTKHIAKNFLDAQCLMENWEYNDDGNIKHTEYLEIVFDIFGLYRNMCPELLDSLSSINMDISEFLAKLEEICEGSDLYQLQTKIIHTFIDFDRSKFSTKTKLFAFVLPRLLKFYYETNDLNTLELLNKIFKNTGIFDGCFFEINIWINGILDLKHFDENVASTLMKTLKFTSENTLEFLEELSTIKSEDSFTENYAEILKNLENGLYEHKTIVVKHRFVSPLVLGFLKYLTDNDISKSLKVYSNFVFMNLLHCQTKTDTINELVKKYDILPNNMKEYILNWVENADIIVESLTVKKSKGRIDVFHNFSQEFLFGNVEEYLKTANLNSYVDLPLNLLQTSIFYVSNLLIHGALTQKIATNSEAILQYMMKNKLIDKLCLESILGHPILISNISFLHLGKEKAHAVCTKFLLKIIKLLQESSYDIEGFLKIYREKLLTTILRIIRKPQKYNNLPEFLETLQILNLNYEQCFKVVSTLLESIKNFQDHSQILLDILIYCLGQISHISRRDLNWSPLSEVIIQNLTFYFVTLNKTQEVDVAKLSVALKKYLEIYPHNIKDVHGELLRSILNLNGYSKENVDLAVFLLAQNIHLFESFKDSVEFVSDICDKKGVLLPILQVTAVNNFSEPILKLIFEKFEPSLMKALQKPQKSGQHFHENYKGVIILVEKFLQLSVCQNFFDKIQKFEVSEIFHAKLMEAMCYKLLNDEITGKQVNNIVLLFIHLQMHLFKRKTKLPEDVIKLNEIAAVFNNILLKLRSKASEKNLQNTCQNETLKLYCKYCLKFGISGESILLKTLKNLITILAKHFEKDDAKLILDMLLSHSEFLDNVLGEQSEIKFDILSLFLVICNNWPEFMERNHVPMLLASYQATVDRCDRIILILLKKFENYVEQTKFYDFKPYIWGRVAANHYSVRLNMENALWRQPKMSDVLEILQEDLVRSTILNYPLKEHLHFSEEDCYENSSLKSYDLMFLLPLFSQLLAPEQQVQTYKFTRSGALSVTVVALSSQDKEVRQAASHVLSRFYFHVDARQTGKDNLLWIRYIEAVCKGTAVLSDFKLNNFSAIYLAKMALILTQPNHVMYVPLSQHLTAKASLDFRTVPELYTFLHSPDTNFKEHRNFILELLRDGLRNEKDFIDFLRSMAFKLFSELYSSSLSDLDTRLLVLDIIYAACKIPLGVKMLCENHSLLTQLYTAINNVLFSSGKEKQEGHLFIVKIVRILLEVVKILKDRHSHFMVSNILFNIIRDDIFTVLGDDCKNKIYEILYLVSTKFSEIFSKDIFEVLLDKSNDPFCKYLFEYGCRFVNISRLDINENCYYLRLLLVHMYKDLIFIR